MDNFGLDVLAERRESFDLAMELAFRHNAPGGKSTHWVVAAPEPSTQELHVADWSGRVEIVTLVLLWSSATGATPHPYEMSMSQSAEFAWGWLQAQDYGREPDHDGSNGRGFRVFVEDWGHVMGIHYAVVGVQPAWAMYGK